MADMPLWTWVLVGIPQLLLAWVIVAHIYAGIVETRLAKQRKEDEALLEEITHG